MTSSTPQSTLGKFFDRAEIKLLLFIVYAVGLACACFWMLPKTIHLRSFSNFALSLLIAHSFYMLVLGLVYSRDFAMLYFSPILLIWGPFEERRLKRYLDRTRNLRKNEPAETVVILGYPDWHKLFGWIKPINFAEEVRWLVRQLEAAGRRFSIYPQATYDDVESLMSNPNVKEVLLFGHGESHGFELRSGEILYYCRFDHPKYRKTLVHQLHCGTSLGTPLREYTVPTENWDKCFFIPEPIRMADIKRRFRPSPTDLESGLE